MWIICAIGWGEIWWTFNGKQMPIETTAIDKELINLTKKSCPKVLFIPTASGDSKGYISNFTRYYTSLWCKVDVLLLHNKFIDLSYLKKQIFESDIVYVWGGNTLKMIKLWRKVWLIPLLQQAHKRGIILSWLSAGSICRCYGGMSDSRQCSNKNAGFIVVKGLNFIPYYHCPHFDRDVKRKEVLLDFVKKTRKKRIVLDEGVAFLQQWNSFKIVKSKLNANAYLYSHKGDEVTFCILDNTSLQKIADL